MLSKGQLEGILNRKTVDGGPATSQHLSMIRRTVRVKIIEASISLRQVYDKDPELKSFIEKNFEWLQSPHGEKSRRSPHKENPEKEVHAFPDIDVSKLEPYKPDESKAFSGFPGL